MEDKSLKSLNAFPFPILGLDSSSSVQVFNSSAEKWCNKNAKIEKGAKLNSVVHPDDLIWFQELFKEVDSIDVVDIRMLRAEQKISFVRLRKLNLNLDDGLSFLLIEDITELQDLRKMADHYQSFPKLNPNPVIEVDENGKVSYLNKAGEDRFSKVDNTSMLRYMFGDLIKEFSEIKSLNTYTRNSEFRIKDNWYYGNFVKIRAGGNVRIYLTDITEKKLKEIENEKQRAALEQTAKLSTLGEMAAGIAHEINNPLSIISGKMAQLKVFMEKDKLDKERIIQTFEKVENMVDRISKIIKSLKSFSRNSDFDPFKPEHAQTILLDSIELTKEKAKVKEVNLSWTDIPQDVMIECRASQISQILVNLVSNAIDAIEGCPERWVKLDYEIKNERLKISVMDCGLGIPPEILAKLMTPFFTTKEAGKGTGLGLSISRGIAEAHGGSLTYDGNSKNTKFILELPLKQDHKRPLTK